MIILAALAPGYAPPPPPVPRTTLAGTTIGQPAITAPDDADLRLYRTINARLRAGDGYYRAAVEEQRRGNYPVTPGFTVRLPTLAYLAAGLGPAVMAALRVALFTAMLLAMWRRLGEEPGGAERRHIAAALLVAGIASGLGPRYDVLHEIWAAQLVALSFALHSPARGRWRAAVAAGALALAVRELVLPYVVLMGALALWRGARREAAAWAAVAVIFLAALAVHLHLAAGPVVPGDPASPSWLALKGIAGLLYKVNHSTFLMRLPVALSGPCVVLALLGWAGWRSPMGLCGFLLTAGYGAAFMLVGRDNNFYWGLLITPILFMGAAFAPTALTSLWRSAGMVRMRRGMAHA